MNRALSFAKRRYTSGNATIDVWPKAPSLIDSFSRLFDSKSTVEADHKFLHKNLFQNQLVISSCNHLNDQIFMTVDENVIVQYLLSGIDTSRP